MVVSVDTKILNKNDFTFLLECGVVVYLQRKCVLNSVIIGQPDLRRILSHTGSLSNDRYQLMIQHTCHSVQTATKWENYLNMICLLASEQGEWWRDSFFGGGGGGGGAL